jgi:hypothetical protein
MTAAILSAASALSQSIRNSADPLRTLSSVLGILAQGCDHDDMCEDLERASSDAQTYAEMADEAAEAKRAELEEDGHRNMASRRDHLFDPEVVL